MWSFDKDENGEPRVKLSKFFASLCWDSPEKKEESLGFRFNRMQQAAGNFLNDFELQPKLESITVEANPSVVVNALGGGLVIYHAVFVTYDFNDGRSECSDTVGEENLPYQEMGKGKFVIKRSDPLIKEYFRLVETDGDVAYQHRQMRRIVRELGDELDEGFEVFSVSHTARRCMS